METSMEARYIAGAAFTLLALWFFWAGFRHKQKSLAELARLKAQGIDQDAQRLHPSLSMLADFAPPLTIFSLGLLGATIAVAFFAVDGLSVFSLFDLAGVLASIGGYGYWMVLKTKYRSIETLRANVSASA
jgi:hypothetical protein